MEDPEYFPRKDPLVTPEIGPAGGLDDTDEAGTFEGGEKCVSIFPEAY